MFAAGSLIAVGDSAGAARLETAVEAAQPELRLAAVQAAALVVKPAVVRTLRLGLDDSVFEIKFTAAEGLATMNTDKQQALPVLHEGLASKQADVVGRALAALTRFGEAIKDKLRSPAELLDSPDPRQRLAALPVVRAMAPGDGVPLLRRLVADTDQEVRRASVDAIEDVVAKDRDQAIKLYKPLVDDADPIVRAKAAGQLSRLVPPPVQTAAAATAASTAARASAQAFEALTGELATAIATPAQGDAATRRVEELADKIAAAAQQLADEAAGLDGAAASVASAAGASPSPATAELVAQARALADEARSRATATRDAARSAAEQAQKYIKAETGDVAMLIAAADAAIAARSLADARANLDRAASVSRRQGRRPAGLDYSYGQLYDQMAARAASTDKRKLLQQAEQAYRRFVKAGAGPRVQHANDRLAEIAEELRSLGEP